MPEACAPPSLAVPNLERLQVYTMSMPSVLPMSMPRAVGAGRPLNSHQTLPATPYRSFFTSTFEFRPLAS
jgi:hypothetical protein